MTATAFAQQKPKSAHAANPNLAERRDWVRYPSDLDAICWTPDCIDGEPWGGIVRDISAGGIGLLCREQPEVNSTLRMKLHSHYTNLSKPLDATVICVQEQNPGEFLVGCQFERELDPEERRQLL